MAYFGNGMESEFYEANNCVKSGCLHYDRGQANSPYICPVMNAHWLCASLPDSKFHLDGSSGRTVLDELIPRDAKGVNQKCKMILTEADIKSPAAGG